MHRRPRRWRNSSSSVHLPLFHNPYISARGTTSLTSVWRPLTHFSSSFPYPVTHQSPPMFPYLPFLSSTTTTLVQVLFTYSHSVGVFCLQGPSPALRPPSFKGCFHHAIPLNRHLMALYFSALISIVERTNSDNPPDRMFKYHSPRMLFLDLLPPLIQVSSGLTQDPLLQCHKTVRSPTIIYTP